MVAWFVLIIILKNWWGLVNLAEDGIWADGWMFLYYGHLLFLFYLVVSAVLPDDVPEAGLDLREFYLDNRRHLWGLMAGVNLLLLIAGTLRPLFLGEALPWSAVAINSSMVAIPASLAWVRRIGYHAAVVLILVAIVMSEVFASF